MVWAKAADGDVFLVVSTLNSYVAIRVGTDDWEWSFGRGVDLGFPFAFVRFLYDKN